MRADFFWPFTVAPAFLVGTGMARYAEVVEKEAREGTEIFGRERQRQQLSGVAILAISLLLNCQIVEA